MRNNWFDYLFMGAVALGALFGIVTEVLRGLAYLKYLWS